MEPQAADHCIPARIRVLRVQERLVDGPHDQPRGFRRADRWRARGRSHYLCDLIRPFTISEDWTGLLVVR